MNSERTEKVAREIEKAIEDAGLSINGGILRDILESELEDNLSGGERTGSPSPANEVSRSSPSAQPSTFAKATEDKLDEIVSTVKRQLLESQRANPAWSKAELWGIERDILPALDPIIRRACEEAKSLGYEECRAIWLRNYQLLEKENQGQVCKIESLQRELDRANEQASEYLIDLDKANKEIARRDEAEKYRHFPHTPKDWPT